MQLETRNRQDKSRENQKKILIGAIFYSGKGVFGITYNFAFLR